MKKIPNELLKKIDIYKPWLESGDQLRIAKEVKMSAVMIHLVLKKKAYNTKILAKVREYAIKKAAACGVSIN